MNAKRLAKQIIASMKDVHPCKCQHMRGDPENSCCAHSMKVLCCCRPQVPA